jgi:hypothetical protein
MKLSVCKKMVLSNRPRDMDNILTPNKLHLLNVLPAFFHKSALQATSCRVLKPMQAPDIAAKEAGKPIGEKSIQILREAAKKGCPKTQYLLARCYLEGRGVAQDVSLAIQYLEIAAETNKHPKAQLLLGKCYLNGLHVKQDRERGIYLLRAADKQRDKEAKELTNHEETISDRQDLQP